eukprot:jgi/Picre1/31028/NNA_006385.t1
MSAALFGHPLTLNFVIGVSVVFISMHLFFSLGGTKGQPSITRQPTKSSSMQLSPSMDHIALSRHGYDDMSFDQSASLGSLGGGEVSMTSIANLQTYRHKTQRLLLWHLINLMNFCVLYTCYMERTFTRTTI